MVIGILVFCGMSVIANIKNISTIALIGDELDQSQTVMTNNTLVPIGQILFFGNLTNFQIAQSFIPEKEIITRVELYIGKNSSTTYPIYLSIRKELTEKDLTYTSVETSQVPTGELGWVEFDFNNISVNTGQTYYIVAITENTTDNWYGWGANNDSISYPLGCAWFSIDDGFNWTNESSSSSSHSTSSFVNTDEPLRFNKNFTWDMCFKTYGRENTPPETPIIDGPTIGKPGVDYNYTFISTDPEGDDIYYHISWGDKEIIYIYGPYSSGEKITLSYNWSEKGNYTITCWARDIYDEVSDIATLVVTIPRNKAINNIPFLNFLYSHPNLFLLLQKLLQHFGT
jgi:hypothetical protein